MENKDWKVITTDCFDHWFDQQDESTQDCVIANLIRLKQMGHNLGRPFADTVYGSTYSNMKELRIQHKGKPIRAFFAFDPLRQAIVLCAGDKSNDKKFYERMIKLADNEFNQYLISLEENNENLRSDDGKSLS